MRRKSLLYESRVEYGGWTVNHVQGCSHGCRYPCYAMMLAKRTGRVSSYEDWCSPCLVENALELLESELPRLSHKISSVHFSFTTDPFMYDVSQAGPFEEVVELTLSLIRRLNSAGIRVTTLTKGVYPERLIEELDLLSPQNQYGISVVSFDEGFREEWEPGAAPVASRIASAKRLAEAGAKTWASIEPYPTPNIDQTSLDIHPLLEAISFATKVVFGRWNYNRRVSAYPGAQGHYERIAEDVAAWCAHGGSTLHIKSGTPLCHLHKADVLGVEAIGGPRSSMKQDSGAAPSLARATAVLPPQPLRAFGN
jgi:DNA repair photolyase